MKRKWLPLFVEILIRSKDIHHSFHFSPEMRLFPEIAITLDPVEESLPNYMKQILHAMCQRNKLELSDVEGNILELAYGDMRIAAR